MYLFVKIEGVSIDDYVTSEAQIGNMRWDDFRINFFLSNIARHAILVRTSFHRGIMSARAILSSKGQIVTQEPIGRNLSDFFGKGKALIQETEPQKENVDDLIAQAVMKNDR
ncbi:MAG: hypothetical protein COA94_02295 [Rickettsiales bacterium]|nr:MAG: hypothetical protein COA94_02295 [Rickettsiales bacterium]